MKERVVPSFPSLLPFVPLSLFSWFTLEQKAFFRFRFCIRRCCEPVLSDIYTKSMRYMEDISLNEGIQFKIVKFILS